MLKTDILSLSEESEALADVQSVSVEDAIRQALEERARASGIVSQARRPRDTSLDRVAERIALFDALALQVAELPVNDSRSVTQIVEDLNAL